MNEKMIPTPLLAVLLAVVLIGAAVGYRTLAPGERSNASTLSGDVQPTDAAQKETASDVADGDTADTIASPADASEAGGDSAPDFTVLDADGNTVRLSERMDRPVILNFWATWCPPCRGELPEFQQAWERWGEQVHFLMVNLTDGSADTMESVASFVEENGYSFPVYYDTEGSAATAYGLSAIPVTVAVGQDGSIRWSQIGAIDADTLEQVIQALLSDAQEVQP